MVARPFNTRSFSGPMVCICSGSTVIFFSNGSKRSLPATLMVCSPGSMSLILRERADLAIVDVELQTGAFADDLDARAERTHER